MLRRPVGPRQGCARVLHRPDKPLACRNGSVEAGVGYILEEGRPASPRSKGSQLSFFVLRLSFCLLITGGILLLSASSPPADGGAKDDGSGEEPEGFRWRPALLQSLAFLGVEHGFRLTTQKNTRRKLRGPFFRDYADSVKGLSGWGDGDPFVVNYIGHPLQGAVSGYIQAHNDPRGITAQFGRNKQYWHSRLKGMAWSAAYSVQYEIGPISDASIGNVGKEPGTKGAVDLVVTPTLGFAWQIGEDALDRYVIVPFEGKVKNRAARVLVRSWLNPSRSFANILRGKAPWSRDTRPGVTRY
jgi:hypothetical protein